jgi:hypothetical protein
MNMFLYSQNGFIFVCIFEFLGKFTHDEMLILVLKVKQLKFKVDIWISTTSSIILFLCFSFLLINYTLWHFSFSHSLFIHFLKKLWLEFVVTSFEIRNQPINYVLESNILDYSF